MTSFSIRQCDMKNRQRMLVCSQCTVFFLVAITRMATFSHASFPGIYEATATYNAITGEVRVTTLGQLHVHIRSKSGSLTPLETLPTYSGGGLWINNADRIGFENLGPFRFDDFSFGSVGAGLPMDDLELSFQGQQDVVILPASLDGNFLYVPEPTHTASAMLLGLAILVFLRRRSIARPFCA